MSTFGKMLVVKGSMSYGWPVEDSLLILDNIDLFGLGIPICLKRKINNGFKDRNEKFQLTRLFLIVKIHNHILAEAFPSENNNNILNHNLKKQTLKIHPITNIFGHAHFRITVHLQRKLDKLFFLSMILQVDKSSFLPFWQN